MDRIVYQSLPEYDHDTFRVRGVPLDWNEEQLRKYLEDRTKAFPTIRSLSTDISKRSKIGTVTFEKLVPLSQGQKYQWAIPSKPSDHAARTQYLSLDKAFVGITTLYSPPSQDHKVNIVAICGLGGHAFGSFKDRGQNHMWLRDSLPYDLISEETKQPMAQVMIYGYDSKVADSDSMQNIEDIATTFRQSLHRLTSASMMQPIILIAHSLGGIIVKEAVITMSKSDDEKDKKLLEAVYGVIFFGVPHDGMNISSLIPMVGNRPNRPLVDSIGDNNSQILTMQRRNFHPALGKQGCAEVFCFYETLTSKTAEQTPDGGWEMTGPAQCLVTKASATHGRQWEDSAEHICAINRSHSDMVKFEPNDADYDSVLERLQGVAQRALRVKGHIRVKTAFLVPHIKNPDYVPRTNMLDSLRQQFGLSCPEDGERPSKRVAIYGPSGSRKRIAIYGLGGVGKTQIVLAFVYWLHDSHPSVPVFWVHASSADSFRKDYAAIATQYKIPGHNDPKTNILSLVKTWLETRLQAQWLMVIDNADDLELFYQHQPMEVSAETTSQQSIEEIKLAGYIPKCDHGLILITTRDRKLAVDLVPQQSPIEIHHMTQEEAHLFMCKILDKYEKTSEDIHALCSKLEYLPLAISQAAAYLLKNETPIRRYLEILEDSDSDLVESLSKPFETVGRHESTSNAVAKTWMVSFDRIRERNPFDSDILYFLSLFHWQAIPRELVVGYCKHIQPEGKPIGKVAIETALGTLKAFSFLSESTDDTLTMHRLVQLVTRERLKNEKNILAGMALSVMAKVFPDGLYLIGDSRSRLLPHVHAVLRHTIDNRKDHQIARATLFRAMCGYSLIQGQYTKAEKYITDSLQLYKGELQKDDPQMLTAMNKLACTFQHQGRWIEAESLQTQVVEIRKRVLGEEHPNTLATINSLASTFQHQGRWIEAESLQTQVLETIKRVLGEEHPNTLATINSLASTFQHQGRWIEAESLQTQVVEIRKWVLGEEHPDTLTAMNNLACTFQHQGRWIEAESLQTQVLKTIKRALGEEHPDTLAAINNLACTFRNQGRWIEAESLHTQVLETRKRVLGEEHPDTLAAMNNLAFTQYSLGRHADAIELMDSCIEARQRIIGPDHPHTLNSQRWLKKWRSGQSV